MARWIQRKRNLKAGETPTIEPSFSWVHYALPARLSEIEEEYQRAHPLYSLARTWLDGSSIKFIGENLSNIHFGWHWDHVVQVWHETGLQHFV